jgi:hypothetical protein
MSKDFDELANLISITRYPKEPEQWVGSDVIAEVVLAAGYVKQRPILVTRGAVNAALLAYYQGITSVKELNQTSGEHQNASERMSKAIYAADEVLKRREIDQALEWDEDVII